MDTESGLSEFVTFNELEETTNIFLWSRDKTLMFLDLYKQYRKLVGSLKIKNLKQMYQIIARELQLKLKIRVTPGHCENKWKVLERAYKKYIDNNKTTGCARKDFEYAEEMDAILGKKKNINPSLLLFSETKHIIEQNMKPHTQVSNEETETNEIMHRDPAQIELQVPTPKTPVFAENQNSPAQMSIAGTPSKGYRTKLMKFDILRQIRAERKQYYEKRLDIEERKLAETIKKNQILQEKNQLLKECIEKNIKICEHFD